MISDDGARMSIDDEEILNNDGAHGVATLDDPLNAKGSAQLSADKHQIRVYYFQGPLLLALPCTYSGRLRQVLLNGKLCQL